MQVRGAAVAGTWYPATAARVAHEVESFLAGAEDGARPEGELLGLIAPHAGLRYSGPVAAYAYRLLRGRRDLTALLVGPSHRAAFDGVALARGAFETPLGAVPVDEDAAGALLAAAPEVIVDLPGPHRAEHSLEMQLPFLQHLVPGLRIVPLLMGSQSRAECGGLAKAVASALAGREGMLLVASSDLSHYHPAAVANALDAQVLEHVERFDAAGLMALLERRHEHACGGGPMVAVMEASRALGADRATVLRYADSGDAGERDKSRVVGYLAAALTRSAS